MSQLPQPPGPPCQTCDEHAGAATPPITTLPFPCHLVTHPDAWCQGLRRGQQDPGGMDAHRIQRKHAWLCRHGHMGGHAQGPAGHAHGVGGQLAMSMRVRLEHVSCRQADVRLMSSTESKPLFATTPRDEPRQPLITSPAQAKAGPCTQPTGNNNAYNDDNNNNNRPATEPRRG